MSKRAPRSWTSIELLLEDDDDPPTGYRSMPGGRVEPAPTGHGTTPDGVWWDGERIAPPEKAEG